MTDHAEVKGVIPMRPGLTKGATCTCGWHSHIRTIEDHFDDVEQIESERGDDVMHGD